MSQPEQTMSGGSMATAKTSNSNSSYENKKIYQNYFTTQVTPSLRVV